MTFEELMSSMVTEPKVTEAKKTVSAPSVPVVAENKSEYENTLDSANYFAEKINSHFVQKFFTFSLRYSRKIRGFFIALK